MSVLGSVVPTVMSSALFTGMSADETALALSSCSARVRAFGPGETVLVEGGLSRRLGIILQGKAAVYKSTGGSRVLMNVLGPTELTGATGMFGKDPHVATEVVSIKGCEVLFIGEAQLKALMQSDFRIAENYMTYLTGRIHFLAARIESVASPSAEEKLFAYIKKNAKGGALILPQNYSALADALATSRASLYRAMDALEKSGHISRRGKTITLLEERL